MQMLFILMVVACIHDRQYNEENGMVNILISLSHSGWSVSYKFQKFYSLWWNKKVRKCIKIIIMIIIHIPHFTAV